MPAQRPPTPRDDNGALSPPLGADTISRRLARRGGVRLWAGGRAGRSNLGRRIRTGPWNRRATPSRRREPRRFIARPSPNVVRDSVGCGRCGAGSAAARPHPPADTLDDGAIGRLARHQPLACQSLTGWDGPCCQSAGGTGAPFLRRLSRAPPAPFIHLPSPLGL